MKGYAVKHLKTIGVFILGILSGNIILQITTGESMNLLGYKWVAILVGGYILWTATVDFMRK